MKKEPAALASQFTGEQSTLASIWTLTRRDDEIFGYTSHDEDIDVKAGYELTGPTTAFTPVTQDAGEFIYWPASGGTLYVTDSDGVVVAGLSLNGVISAALGTTGDIYAAASTGANLWRLRDAVLLQTIAMGTGKYTMRLHSAPGGGYLRGILRDDALGNTYFATFDEATKVFTPNTTYAVGVGSNAEHMSVGTNGSAVATFNTDKVVYWPYGGNPVQFNSGGGQQYKGCQWSGKDNLIYLVDLANKRIEVRDSAHVLQTIITPPTITGSQGITIGQDARGVIWVFAHIYVYEIWNGAIQRTHGPMTHRAPTWDNIAVSPYDRNLLVPTPGGVAQTAAGVARPTVKALIFWIAYFKSAPGITPSQMQWSERLNVDNLNIQSIIHDDGITDADLLAGVWDYATVEIAYINYVSPTDGVIRLPKGKIGEVTSGRTSFEAELRGLMQHFQQTVGRLYGAACDADLGDERCRVDLTPFTVTGAVTTVDSNKQFRDSSRTEANGWFDAAKVTWLTGNNAGLEMEIKSYTLTGGVFVLHMTMPYAIQIGDTYRTYAGCLKRKIEDCKTKFNNIVNNRSFDLVPGMDKMMSGGR